MAKQKHSKPSPETQAEASQLARANQRPGQTKEQTKIIAQGIQKGIEQYKKQQKAKAREQDKARKKEAKSKEEEEQVEESPQPAARNTKHPFLPWTLLALTWSGIIVYALFFRATPF